MELATPIAYLVALSVPAWLVAEEVLSWRPTAQRTGVVRASKPATAPRVVRPPRRRTAQRSHKTAA